MVNRETILREAPGATRLRGPEAAWPGRRAQPVTTEGHLSHDNHFTDYGRAAPPRL
jgi:hypothetical protein